MHTEHGISQHDVKHGTRHQNNNNTGTDFLRLVIHPIGTFRAHQITLYTRPPRDVPDWVHLESVLHVKCQNKD